MVAAQAVDQRLLKSVIDQIPTIAPNAIFARIVASRLIRNHSAAGLYGSLSTGPDGGSSARIIPPELGKAMSKPTIPQKRRMIRVNFPSCIAMRTSGAKIGFHRFEIVPSFQGLVTSICHRRYVRKSGLGYF